MLGEGSPLILTRRNWILLAGAGFASWSSIYGFGGKEFWETKEPAEWNADEIAKLMTKSPWAKAVSAERTKTQKYTMPSDPMPPTAIPGSRSRNTIGMGGSRARLPGSGASTSRKSPSTKTVTTYKGTVVWESAAPVRTALNTKLPDGFEGQYVLGVSGVPLAKSESKGAIDRLRQITTLQTKNRQPLEAAGAQLQRENGTVYLFGFAKEALSISRDDKEVVFTTHMGNLAFTAKFSPKDMLYHGELSV
jgi:hypothetical protein